MKRRFLFYLQIILLGFFIFSAAGAIIQFIPSSHLLSGFDPKDAKYNQEEAYDPTLARLNSVKKLEQYCDSVYTAKVFSGNPTEFAKSYIDVVSNAIRNRFFHGYSYYSIKENFVSALSTRIAMPGLNALVIPDDILKHPYAACSQQSIVMMEVLINKGFKTRKVGFLGKKYGGHFAFEAFYEGSWHFHDPNMEPDKTVFAKYGTPGIDFLVKHPDVLLSAYHRYSKETIMDIFPNYWYGSVNKFPAPRAIVFQKVTKTLSYSLWLIFLVALFFVRRKYLKAKKTAKLPSPLIALPRLVSEVGQVGHPEYRAHSR